MKKDNLKKVEELIVEKGFQLENGDSICHIAAEYGSVKVFQHYSERDHKFLNEKHWGYLVTCSR